LAGQNPVRTGNRNGMSINHFADENLRGQGRPFNHIPFAVPGLHHNRPG
jgi:hypothetical protein